MSEFRPTHRITVRPYKGDPWTETVMLCEDAPGEGGPAYTAEEWEADENASWGVSDGEWLCEGQATPGGQNGDVEVERLTDELVAACTAGESAYYRYATSLARQTGRYGDLYKAAAAHADRVAPLQDCDCTELCSECRSDAQWNCVVFCGELARLARLHRRSQAAVQAAGGCMILTLTRPATAVLLESLRACHDDGEPELVVTLESARRVRVERADGTNPSVREAAHLRGYCAAHEIKPL